MNQISRYGEDGGPCASQGDTNKTLTVSDYM
jgi:hypothetical protein